MDWCARVGSILAYFCGCFSRPVHLFCDARGEPPHLGAVLVMGRTWYWTHVQPSKEVLQHFHRRSDNQIMALELLSISLGMSTFEHLIANKCVVVHSDNTGSEVCPWCVRSVGSFVPLGLCLAGVHSKRDSQEA